jgi:hypothetical protein
VSDNPPIERFLGWGATALKVTYECVGECSACGEAVYKRSSEFGDDDEMGAKMAVVLEDYTLLCSYCARTQGKMPKQSS